jgi:CxxC motif-containing protein (DUF1111 family)
MRNWSLLPALVLGAACLAAADAPDPALSAGAFTVPLADANAYSQPAPALSERQRASVLQGRAAFNRAWVVPGLSTGDWGVGPTFVADRCGACHREGGRGTVPKSTNEQLLGLAVRVSVPGTDAHGGPRPLDNYGDQLQNRALQGQTPELMFEYEPVPAEADLYLDWDERIVKLADGTEVSLRSPRLSIENPAFGPLPADTMTSLRLTPPVFGLGLLAAVPEQTLLAIAEDQRRLGFNGRPNYAWDAINGRMALARFGWKASQPSLRQQIAGAALGEMGVTSSLFPKQNCPDVQTICRREAPGNEPELSDAAWDELELMLLGLGVPAARNLSDAAVQRGGILFEQMQCSVCHQPTLRTADYFARLPELSRQTFHAYTDLLLHDMGDGLADHRPDYAASGRDWRTPPLWGLGLSRTVNGSTVLLHDGRARNVTEAILWHGGEAQRARDAFARLSKQDRDALIAFVNAI